MEEKKALKGFADLRYFPVTKNDEANYTVGEKAAVPGAQECTKADTRNDYSIAADDETYDEGSDYQSTELKITVAEMKLKDLAVLSGAKYDTSKQEMTETSLDRAPDVALGFSGLMLGGGKRLFQYYCAKLTDYKVDLSTKGQGNGIKSVELTFKCRGRACDKAVRTTKDVAAPLEGSMANVTWLDTVTAVAPGG